MFAPKLAVTIFLVSLLICENRGKPSLKIDKRSEEARAIDYLERLEPIYSQKCNIQMQKRWNYITNVTDEHQSQSNAASTAFLNFQGEKQVEIIKEFPHYESFENEALKREIKYLRTQGPAGMEERKLNEMNDLGGTWESDYSTASVCQYNTENPNACDNRLVLNPDIEKVMRESTDYDELAYYYTKWHDVMGIEKVSAANYKHFIDLQNEMARKNGFKDMSEMWVAPYDDGSTGWTATKFKKDMLNIWEDLKPLYLKLHSYVRMKLKANSKYTRYFKSDGYIPANLLGNMWAQDWSAVDSRTKPFPNEPSLDATEAMNQKGYTVPKMIKVAESFFTSLGLEPMTDTFWRKSMFEKPANRDVICHASAEDFCLGKNGDDFRIKMCAKVTMGDLVTVHHEMGHIQYYQMYKHLDFVFRTGANPGFHEAIGDALALSVTTPYHLQCVLELPMNLPIDCKGETTGEITPMDINFLYIMALQKFAFFPFAISMDQWRWEVFEGKIQSDQYNNRWWELRKEIQGITPPSERPSTAFDPAAKYHIVSNVPYIRYFVSHILQFQFYEAMCIAAKKYNPNDPNSKPLYQCDFAGSEDAGTLLRKMMELGFSKPWPEALAEITGSPKMSVSSLLNYFKPLFDKLDVELTNDNKVPPIEVEADSTTTEGGTSAATTLPNSTPKLSEGEDEDDDQELAAIILGAVLGIGILVLLLGYFLQRMKCLRR